jgi:quaternary ammonium compound-resistance protein SugE
MRPKGRPRPRDPLPALPAGTAYALWVGIGATLTIVYAMLTGQESFTALKALFPGLIIGGVVGLKLLN